MDSLKNFCINVKNIRIWNGISLTAMAKTAGMALSTLKRIEQGDLPHGVGINQAGRIARHFGCQVYELFEPTYVFENKYKPKLLKL